MRGESALQLSCQKLIMFPLPNTHRTPLLRRYLWFKIYFHILETLPVFLTFRKLFFVKYLANTTFTHKLSGLLNTFQPSLARLAALISSHFLIPNPPSHSGLQILSHKTRGNGPCLFHDFILFCQKKSLFSYSFSLRCN